MLTEKSFLLNSGENHRIETSFEITAKLKFGGISTKGTKTPTKNKKRLGTVSN